MSGFYDPSNLGYEPDIDDRGARTIIVYIVVVSTLFFSCLGGLFVYFRYEADREIARKVLTVDSPALKALRQREAAELSGMGVKAGSTAEKIEDAMAKTVSDLRASRQQPVK